MEVLEGIHMINDASLSVSLIYTLKNKKKQVNSSIKNSFLYDYTLQIFFVIAGQKERKILFL